MNKPQLRRWAKATRAQLETDHLSAAAVDHLAAFLVQQAVQHVLIYAAFGSELDPQGLQNGLQARFYLPRLEGEQIRIHPLPCEMMAHPYGMLEPAPSSPTADPGCLQAVVVPGLAFDQSGHRLGYGKGYYDRFLARLPPAVLTIGLCPQALLLPQLPADPWDVPVQYLASEQGLRKTG